jgi:hypothetical protein
MFVKKKLIVLPHALFPGLESSVTNKTPEVVFFGAHFIDLGIDPKVESIVKNSENTIYVNPEYKTFLSTDCNLVTTDAQKKKTNISVFSRNECSVLKTISVKNFLKHIETIPKESVNKYDIKEMNDMLTAGLMFDLIDLQDLIYFPQQRWKQTPEWVTKIDGSLINLNNCFVSSFDEIILDLESVMHYSNNAFLTEENFVKLKMMLENNQDVNLAVGMMNNINPTKSFVELLVLNNYIPIAYRNKNKRKILKALYAIYTLPYLDNDISLVNIETFCKMNGFELSLDKQEFIADNYVNSNIETSSMFNLKIKIKS